MTMASSAAVREYVFGGFVFTPALMCLSQDGKAVTLSHGAFQTLQVLIGNRHRVVTKRELLDTVWAGTVVEENNLNQCISALRKAFGDTRKDALFIATIPGEGYRFVMEVTERDRLPAENAAPAPGMRHFPRSRIAAAAAACVLCGLGVAGWKAMVRPEMAVLVLPLQGFDPDPDSGYVRKGMATELEAALARTPGLHVAAGIPEAVLEKTDPAEAARKVNAQALLRGQIRRSGDRLAFTFELVNPQTQRILWSDQFTAPRSDLSGAEARVVAGVVRAIEPGQTVPQIRKADPAAHELYVRGRVTASTRAPADLQQSIGLYERAVQIDPAYADAYTGLADAFGLLAVNVKADPVVLKNAKAAALKAVELDRDSAPAHAALGLAYYADWDWEDARRELQMAVQLNPYYSITHHRLAMLHYVFSDYAAAEAELKQAEGLNPYVLAHAGTLAEVLIGDRKYNEVLQVSQLMEQNDAGNGYPHFLKMQAYRGLGNKAAALSEIRVVNELDPSPIVRATLAMWEGRPADAKAIAEKEGTEEIPWAVLYAQLGERNSMLAVLNRLIDDRSVIVVAMKDDPVFDAYRKDPEFQASLARLHLPRS